MTRSLSTSSVNAPPDTFHDLSMTLQRYWSDQGCQILPSYDLPLGAGTFHPATCLRALGAHPWSAAFVQPCRRPADGRYGENPNRLQSFHQFQVILKPAPDDIQELYINSLRFVGIDPEIHDIRFVEDDWDSPTLGAWGLGWECWCDGMEITQFTYFQQVAGFDCIPVSGEIAYGLERLALFLQQKESVFDLVYSWRKDGSAISYGELFLAREQQFSRSQFDFADPDRLKRQFDDAEADCSRLLDESDQHGENAMPEPAFDHCVTASHLFNLLDASGAISVTERQAYILRVRQLSHRCGKVWIAYEPPLIPHQT